MSARIDEFWRQFHRLWGLNATGFYDKLGWDELRQMAEQLHRESGLERRTQARAKLREVPHD